MQAGPDPELGLPSSAVQESRMTGGGVGRGGGGGGVGGVRTPGGHAPGRGTHVLARRAVRGRMEFGCQGDGGGFAGCSSPRVSLPAAPLARGPSLWSWPPEGGGPGLRGPGAPSQTGRKRGSG